MRNKVKFDEAEEGHAKELARQKQNWITAERLRREGWEKEKTREIKEVTIKGIRKCFRTGLVLACGLRAATGKGGVARA